MTRQHFNALAEAVKAMDLNRADRQHAALMIANYTGKFNPRFDRARFLAACGVA